MELTKNKNKILLFKSPVFKEYRQILNNWLEPTMHILYKCEVLFAAVQAASTVRPIGAVLQIDVRASIKARNGVTAQHVLCAGRRSRVALSGGDVTSRV